MIFLGIDTSCYTTSIACVSHNSIVVDMRTPFSGGTWRAGPAPKRRGIFAYKKSG